MARGSAVAREGAQSGLDFSKGLQGQNQGLYATLAPQLAADVINPQGLSPQEKANMNTAAQETAGGSMAGAVGQGALRAARTKNAGGADAAIAESARESGRQLSRASLGTELEDAQMRARKQAAAKAEMGQLFGMTGGEANQALGQVASNVDANTRAAEQSWNWAKYILDPAMQAAGTGAGLAACWIAEAIYGADDLRTFLLRTWLNGPFRSTWYGRLIMRLYIHFGQSIAAQVSKRPWIRRLFLPLFEMALKRARTWDRELAYSLGNL